MSRPSVLRRLNKKHGVTAFPLFSIQIEYQNGGREVKTSALVSRRSWVRITPESPVKFLFHRHSESTEYTVLYIRRCRAKLNKLFITLRKDFINLNTEMVNRRPLCSYNAIARSLDTYQMGPFYSTHWG